MEIRYTIYSSFVLLLFCCYTICCAGSEQPQDDAIKIVLDILKSDDRDMHAAAISMVNQMPGTEVTKALVKELPNLSPITQVQLLSVLGDRGDAAALPAVLNFVKSDEKAIRIAALKALGQLGDASSVSLLVQIAATTTGQEQKVARNSLYRLRGSQVNQEILAGIPKADAEVKIELIRSVGQRNISKAVSVVLKTAKDTDSKVRTESLKALKVVAGPDHLSALLNLLLKVESSSDRNVAQRIIAAVAHKIDDKNRQAEAVLTLLPSVKDVQGRCSLLTVLGKIGDNSALPSLREALNSDNVDIRGAAIRALADWPTSEPAGDLLKMAQNSENKIHQILALRGTLRLLGLESKRPVKETVEMYSKAMSLAPDTGEKRRVLSGLARAKSLASLQIAANYIQDKSLFKEAQLAVVKIAGGIYVEYPRQTKDVLKKIIQTSENELMRQQAQELINRINRLEDTAEVSSEKEN